MYVFIFILLSRAHEILSRAHDLVTRAHDIVSRAHDIVSRAHDLSISCARLSKIKIKTYTCHLCATVR